jgi:hypothetical protein
MGRREVRLSRDDEQERVIRVGALRRALADYADDDEVWIGYETIEVPAIEIDRVRSTEVRTKRIVLANHEH